MNSEQLPLIPNENDPTVNPAASTTKVTGNFDRFSSVNLGKSISYFVQGRLRKLGR